MNLNAMLEARAEAGDPVRIALIGAGKFGAMFLNQAGVHRGFHILALADLSADRARETLSRIGWDEARGSAVSPDEAYRNLATWVTEDPMAAIEAQGVEVVIDATGDPKSGILHARAAIANGRHIVMVNVEADVLAGPALADEARKAGVVYSLAYGDQPALIAEMVDWARTAGLKVTCAGKGTKYLPAFHAVTPDDVWTHYGLTPEAAAAGGMNPQMFNSFLDGTKSAIEMAAVANACGLTPPEDGLGFPPCGVDDLSHVLRPTAIGGVLSEGGTVEVVSSLERDGRPVFRDLRWGVYTVFEAPNDYAARCFREYGLPVDATGRFASMYKPFHLIGLELGISVASAALRREATGQPARWSGDAVAVAKRDLKAGERLDGEGGYTVWGKLIPAARSAAMGALPIGLAHNVTLTTDLPAGQIVTMGEVSLDMDDPAVVYRLQMERSFLS